MNATKPAQHDTNEAPLKETAHLQPLTREMLDEQAREVTRLALAECTTGETVTLNFGGRAMELRTLDTRLFVLQMSRFISMN